MDVLYEESAVNQNSIKDEKKYKVINIFFKIFIILSVICVVITLTNLPAALNKSAPPKDVKLEDWNKAIATARMFSVFFGFQSVFFILMSVFLYMWRKRVNISYDYTLVSGEIRISKVFNINKRKFLYKVQPDEILQIGDVENSSYDRLRSDPTTKQVILTSNPEPAIGKFFMYILTSGNTGKQLLILECREEFLINILKFVKRGTLESDYVPQEKKEQN